MQLLAPTIIPPRALRLCFGGPISRERWAEGLQQIAELIDQPAHLASLSSFSSPGFPG